jgi:hypothetical protein
MLRIVRITTVGESWNWEGKDIFSGDPVDLTISGKMKMHNARDVFVAGDECVVLCHPKDLYYSRSYEVILRSRSERGPSQAKPVGAIPCGRPYWSAFFHLLCPTGV